MKIQPKTATLVLGGFIMALAAGAVVIAFPRPSFSRSAGAVQTAVDLRSTTAQRDVARDLMRALVISLENYAAEGPGGAGDEIKPIQTFMSRLPAGVRDGLTKATRRFSAQGEKGLKAFYGPLYAPTPQTRLQKLPSLVMSLRDRKKLFLKPFPINTGPQDKMFDLLLSPGPSVFENRRAEEAPVQKKFSAPYDVRLRLDLRSILVNRLNDDDTPDDEIYMGVIAVPGLPSLTRIPAGDDYFRLRRGQTRTLDIPIADFGSVHPGGSFTVFASVFEYDDGTWGEIWSTFIDVAQFAFNQWLQVEIGTVAAQIVEYFLDDLWGWIAGWFENPDDFIDTVTLSFDYEHEPKFWAPGPSGGAQFGQEVLKFPSGADANYRFTFLWMLNRRPAVRLP